MSRAGNTVTAVMRPGMTGRGRVTIGIDQIGRTDSSIPSNTAAENGAGDILVNSLRETRMYYRFTEGIWTGTLKGLLFATQGGLPYLKGRGSSANEGRILMYLINSAFDLETLTWDNQSSLAFVAGAYIIFRMGNELEDRLNILTPRHPGISSFYPGNSLARGLVLFVNRPQDFTGQAEFTYPHHPSLHAITVT